MEECAPIDELVSSVSFPALTSSVHEGKRTNNADVTVEASSSASSNFKSNIRPVILIPHVQLPQSYIHSNHNSKSNYSSKVPSTMRPNSRKCALTASENVKRIAENDIMMREKHSKSSHPDSRLKRGHSNSTDDEDQYSGAARSFSPRRSARIRDENYNSSRLNGNNGRKRIRTDLPNVIFDTDEESEENLENGSKEKEKYNGAKSHQLRRSERVSARSDQARAFKGDDDGDDEDEDNFLIEEYTNSYSRKPTIPKKVIKKLPTLQLEDVSSDDDVVDAMTTINVPHHLWCCMCKLPRNAKYSWPTTKSLKTSSEENKKPTNSSRVIEDSESELNEVKEMEETQNNSTKIIDARTDEYCAKALEILFRMKLTPCKNCTSSLHEVCFFFLFT
jgi:hypothetical protein